MFKKEKFFLFFLLLLFLSVLHPLIAQNEDLKSRSLKDLIYYFQEKENYKFSFSDQIIEDITLVFETTDEVVDIDIVIDAIKKQSALSIKKTSNKTYIIYLSHKPIKWCGKIIDASTKKPLSKIHITDSINKTFTDSNGEFSLTTKVFRKLTITGIGYQKKIIEITNPKQKKCTEIEFSQKYEELDKVTLIQDYLTLGVSKKKDGSIELSPSQLKILPGLIEPDIMQSIQLLPGIISFTGGASDISIRGSSSDQNLILWDGIKVYNSGHLFDQISAFNPYITENIKIFKNGTSAQYGDRVSGVIDISSISEVPDKIHGGAGVNLTNFDVNLKTPLAEKLGFIAAVRHSENKIYNNKFNNLKKKVFQNTNLDETKINENTISEFENKIKFYDVNAKLIWDLPDGSKVQFSNLFMKNTLNFKSVIANSIKTEDTVTISNTGSSIEWKKTTKKKWNHTLLSYYTKYDYRFNRDLSFSEAPSLNSAQINEVIDIGGHYHINIPFSKKANLLSGYQYIYNDVLYKETNDEESDFFGIQNFKIDNHLSTHSVFSEFIYDTEFVRLQGGIRTNYFSRLNDFFIEPRLNASCKITNKIQLEVSGEIKSQVLRQSYQTSNTRLASIKNAWIIASEKTTNTEAIPVIKSKQLSTGFSYKVKNFGVILESYIRENKGLVTLKNDTETINDDLYFSGKSTVMGIDILIKKKIRKYRTWLGYSLSQNLLFFSDISNKDFFASNDATHVLNWSHTIDIKKFELGISWNYRTGLPYSQPSSGTQNSSGEPILVYDSRNNLRLPDYQSFNASLLYSVKKNTRSNWDIKLGISLENILNKKNIISRQYKLSPVSSTDEPDIVFDNIEVYKFDNISLPLTPDILFRIDF